MDDERCYTFIIVDPQPLSCYALRCLLDSQPRFRVLRQVSTGEEALDSVRHCRPDCLLLAFEIPDLSAFQVLRELASFAPASLRRIMICNEPDPALVMGALYLGAVGILKRSWSTEVMLRTISKIVLAGEYSLERQQVAALVREISRGDPPHMRYGLTHRELQIISCIVDGCSNRQISELFRVSEQTIKHHLTNIFDKLGVSSRLELASFAFHHGLNTVAPEAPVRGKGRRQ